MIKPGRLGSYAPSRFNYKKKSWQVEKTFPKLMTMSENCNQTCSGCAEDCAKKGGHSVKTFSATIENP